MLYKGAYKTLQSYIRECAKPLLDLAETALLGSSALGRGSLSGEGRLSEVRAADRKFMVERSASVCSSTSREEKVT